MKIHTYLLVLLLCCATTGFSQEVLRLGENETPGNGKLADLAWLAGYWTGSGLGGDCEELWLPPTDSTMHGVFRFVEAGKTQFTEYMVIEQEGSTLTVKIKHFSRDLSPWEEKDEWVRFKLIKTEGQTAYFHGITYHRALNKLTIRLQLKTNDSYQTEEFVFVKTDL